MAYRVIQWTTGNVGKESVKGVIEHPDLELAGCFAHAADKVGRDVGELCGIAPLGIAATDAEQGGCGRGDERLKFVVDLGEVLSQRQDPFCESSQGGLGCGSRVVHRTRT